MNLKYEVGQEVAIEAPKTITEIKTSEIKSITVCKTGAKYLTPDGAFSEEQLDAFAKSTQPQQEDKPTPKYKASDKMRVIGNTCAHLFAKNDIVTLAEPHCSGDIYAVGVSFAWNVEGCDECYIRECDLEPYVEDKPKFKVGDKVRLKDWKSRSGWSEDIKDKPMTVEATYEKTCSVEENSYSYRYEWLEPYTEPEFKPYLCDRDTHYGFVGEKTEYKDAVGRSLAVGDVVENFRYGKLLGKDFVAKDDDKAFVMGIKTSCDDETGTIINGFKIIKVKGYDELEHGEKHGWVEYKGKADEQA